MKKKQNIFYCFAAKKSFLEAELLLDFIDIHTHYLPGVDDGFQCQADTIAALEAMRAWGVKRIYFTPHVMADLPANRVPFLKEQFVGLALKIPEGMEVRLGAEYMLDASFYVREEEGLLFLGDRYVLIEMSYLYPSPELDQIVYNLQIRNYIPLLAHPERYLFLNEKKHEELRDRGCRYQLNLMSLSGQYGVRAQQVAWYLLQHGMYDFVGTDIHRLPVFRRSMERLKLTVPEEELLHRLIRQNELLW